MLADPKPALAPERDDPLTREIIRGFYDVYNELGTGFLESLYKEAMRIALIQAGFDVQAELAVPVSFRGQVIGMYRADLIVNEKVLLELKVASSIDRTHEKQIIHYLRSTPLELGLLLNFGPQPQVRRFILENSRKRISAHL